MLHGDKYFLKTAQLGFREWTQGDLPLAFSIWGDAEVTKYVGGPFSEKQVAERLSRETASMKTYGVEYWPIFLLETDEHVGAAGMRIYKLEEKIYATGYYLRRKFWGQGLASEAGRAVIEYAFTTLGANSLFAGHHPDNAASRAVLAKLGFKFTHKQLYPPTGLQHDSYLLMNPSAKTNS
jgi:ribosomal-protein-alanine N-acetyltransferase